MVRGRPKAKLLCPALMDFDAESVENSACYKPANLAYEGTCSTKCHSRVSKYAPNMLPRYKEMIEKSADNPAMKEPTKVLRSTIQNVAFNNMKAEAEQFLAENNEAAPALLEQAIASVEGKRTPEFNEKKRKLAQLIVKSAQLDKVTVLKPVPGSGSRAKCAQFRGSNDAKHVSSWFQPWATLWPTCHMLVPASLLQSVECSTECKNSIFHCTIGCNKYKSSLASGASPQTPPGGLFLPPGPPPPAWVHAAHRHGMVSPRKVWFQRPCSSLVLVPEEVVEPASGRYKVRHSLCVQLSNTLHYANEIGSNSRSPHA